MTVRPLRDTSVRKKTKKFHWLLVGGLCVRVYVMWGWGVKPGSGRLPTSCLGLVLESLLREPNDGLVSLVAVDHRKDGAYCKRDVQHSAHNCCSPL